MKYIILGLKKTARRQLVLFEYQNWIWLGLSTTLTSEDKNGGYDTISKMKNLDSIVVYDGLGANI